MFLPLKIQNELLFFLFCQICFLCSILRFPNHCTLLFTFYTALQLFQKWVCISETTESTNPEVRGFLSVTYYSKCSLFKMDRLTVFLLFFPSVYVIRCMRVSYGFMRFVNQSILFFQLWTDQSKRPVPHLSVLFLRHTLLHLTTARQQDYA